MADNASLSDYLHRLRRDAAPAHLTAAMTAGAIATLAGLALGARFSAVTGLGLAIFGIGAWARLNQLADARMDGSFAAVSQARASRHRAVGAVSLGAAAVGGLLLLYSLAIRFLGGATGP